MKASLISSLAKKIFIPILLLPCFNIFVMLAYNWVVISKFNLRTSALIDRKTSGPINMLVRTRRRAKYVFISVIVSAPRPSLAAATGQKNPDCGDTKRDNTGKNEMVALITPSPHSYLVLFCLKYHFLFTDVLCVSLVQIRSWYVCYCLWGH